MQERRTTVRIERSCRVQYCPETDFLPRDGRLTNLSERGAGWVAREPHQAGERVTINFSIPGEEEPLTATGVVRWSTQDARGGRWHPAGIEWLPIEEATRNRLHQFLSREVASASSRTVRKPRIQIGGPAFPTLTIVSVVAGGVVLAIGTILWLALLQRQNRQLAATVQQRTMAIQQLVQREQQLQQELGAARTRLNTSTTEVTQLHRQRQSLQGEVQTLHQEVGRAQESYAKASEERNELMQKVLDLEQERLLLRKRLSSVPELRQAIREAIDAHRQEEQTQRRLLAEARREAERQQSVAGNHGYLIQAGQPTANRSTVWIRVHEPEPFLTPSETK